MKLKTKIRSFVAFLAFILIVLTVISCDIYKPQKTFCFAVAENDYLYVNMYSHLKSLLEKNGYEISVQNVHLSFLL